MNSDIPTWVRHAADLPLAFAQVREDALLDLHLARLLGDGLRIIMVASGGCTAAALAASGMVERLHLVDPNPAQLALTRLKARLLQDEMISRLALLGHAHMPPEQRRSILSAQLAALGLPDNALGPPDIVAEFGPDHAGRYERVFAALREELGACARDIDALLLMKNPAGQAARVAPGTPLGMCLDAAFDSAMALPNLVALFGQKATNNPVEPFARHFARRTRHALATLPAASNPYLWQMLAGRFPEGSFHPWVCFPPADRMPEIEICCALMDQALAVHRGEFNLAHLSNILDWLTPAEAQRTLDLAFAALRPGGMVFIRQLNSTLDIPRMEPRFEWVCEDADEFHRRDRSFFYRSLHLGRKP